MLIEEYGKQFGLMMRKRRRKKRRRVAKSTTLALPSTTAMYITLFALAWCLGHEDGELSKKMQWTMLALGKAPKEWEHVDMQQKMMEKMMEVGLSN